VYAGSVSSARPATSLPVSGFESLTTRSNSAAECRMPARRFSIVSLRAVHGMLL
jgi:hypothetical protein